jgi:hypothetical protein
LSRVQPEDHDSRGGGQDLADGVGVSTRSKDAEARSRWIEAEDGRVAGREVRMTGWPEVELLQP